MSGPSVGSSRRPAPGSAEPTCRPRSGWQRCCRPRLGVALSGGVDSSVLIALAARSLGRGRVLAVLGVSPSLPAEERDAAHQVAGVVGVPVVEVVTHEGEGEAYRRNRAVQGHPNRSRSHASARSRPGAERDTSTSATCGGSVSRSG